MDALQERQALRHHLRFPLFLSILRRERKQGPMEGRRESPGARCIRGEERKGRWEGGRGMEGGRSPEAGPPWRDKGNWVDKDKSKDQSRHMEVGLGEHASLMPSTRTSPSFPPSFPPAFPLTSFLLTCRRRICITLIPSRPLIPCSLSR
jgi:hypothetical protein